MASRRDELNAYSFARKRAVASFLKPLPNGSVESAPRPLRTLLPTTVLGMLILAGFGACGIIKPTAPQGWDDVGEKVIVGDQSTTRYVVLKNGNGDSGPHKRLHPVLNLASARLLLDPEKFEVVKVKEAELDDGDIPKGPTLGIPYAPDRLPTAEDAAQSKVWALCERPGSGAGAQSQRAVFVLSEDDDNREKLVEGPGRLGEQRALYVEAEPEEGGEPVQYLVDHRGVAHRLDAGFGSEAAGESLSAETRRRLDDVLRRILFGQQAQPQPVSREWLDTLIESPLPIFLPPVDGVGDPSQATDVPEAYRTVGRVLQTGEGESNQQYVVLRDRLAPVSDFTAELLLEGPVGNQVMAQGEEPEAVRVPQANVLPSDQGFMERLDGEEVPWPEEETDRANDFEEPDGNRVVCSVYHGRDRQTAEASTDVRELSAWAGQEYPAPVSEGGRSSYVSPGSGLLYRQVTGEATSGPLFLVTDTGLRYSVQVNNDSGQGAGKAGEKQNKAQIRLGYGEISAPPLVPKEWSQLLSAGPSLNTDAARQPQGA